MKNWNGGEESSHGSLYGFILRSSLKVSNQVSHPYKTTGKITVPLYQKFSNYDFVTLIECKFAVVQTLPENQSHKLNALFRTTHV